MSSDRDPEAGRRVVEALAAQGVEYLFTTFGTDHPPIIRGLAREGAPTALLAPDETVAASAAHGYAQATGEPAAVLVHVDVGTANLGPSVANAARTRVPLIVLAGRTPLTTRGEQPGTRSIFVHYYQDVYDQHGLVREYTKWEYELETPANVERVVARGVDLARSPPPGPVYLTMPREVLRGTADGPADGPTDAGPDTDVRTAPPAGGTTLDAGTREGLVERLREASHPLLITSYLGRDPGAVGTLVAFAETAGVGVVEAAPAFELNLPRDHPLHLGFAAEPHLDDADLVLVAGCDVPWVPARASPRGDATVVQVDADPDKPQYPLWDFPADVRVRAAPETVLADLTEAFREAGGADDGVADRAARLREAGAARREEWTTVPAPGDAEHVTPAVLSRAIGDALDPGDVVVDETVTNTVAVLRHLPRTEPGTYYSYCSSGLGWATGASLGIRLAHPDRRVVTAVGDGSYVLGNPLAAIQMAQGYGRPGLTVVYNNGGWQAVADAIRDQYGEPSFPTEGFTRFDPAMDFAAPADGLDCHAERVEAPGELEGALDRALAAVDDGTEAVVDVVVCDGGGGA